MLLVTAISSAQFTVKSGGASVKSGGVIFIGANEVAITYPSAEAIRRLRGKFPNLLSVKKDLENLKDVEEAIAAGRKALADYVRTVDGPATINSSDQVGAVLRQLVEAKNKLLPVLGEDEDDTNPMHIFIRNKVDSAPRAPKLAFGEGAGQAAVASLIFDAAAEYLEIRSIQIAAQVQAAGSVAVSVRINEQREVDGSRRRSVRFLEELTDEDRQKMASIQAKVQEFGDNPLGYVFGAAKAKVIERAKALGEELKKQVATFERDVKAQGDRSAQALGEPVVKAWGKVRDDIAACRSLTTKIGNGDYLASLDPSQALQQVIEDFAVVETTVSDINSLLRVVGDLNPSAQVDQFRTLIEKFVADGNNILSRAVAEIRVIVDSALAEANLIKSYKQIASVLVPIDLTQPIEVDLGSLEKPGQDLKPFDSGDRMDVDLVAKQGGGNLVALDSARFYTYKRRAIDRSFLTIFTKRENSSWAPSVAWADTVKFYGSDRMYNEYLAPGIGFMLGAAETDGKSSYSAYGGPAISLFDDRLFLGYGWDLTGRRGRLYFGIRLLK